MGTFPSHTTKRRGRYIVRDVGRSVVLYGHVPPDVGETCVYLCPKPRAPRYRDLCDWTHADAFLSDFNAIGGA